MNKIVYDQFEIEFEKDEIALEFDASKSDWTFITKHTPLVKKIKNIQSCAFYLH